MTLNPKEYLVLDVETNGLRYVRDDLLSVSLYKPDDGKIFTRLLPLEKQTEVRTTKYNGIVKKDLKNAKALTQEELDRLFEEYELDKRTVLTYSELDKNFLKEYFKRKKLQGFEKINLYNFKHNIISSRFTGGNVTKDNLCKLYEIGNVKDVHTSENDCILEWKLFQKMDGKRLLVTNDDVFELNDEYLIPASIFAYPNMKYHEDLNRLPPFHIIKQRIFKKEIDGNGLSRFRSNFDGILLEHIVNSMINVERLDPRNFTYQNKRILKYLGTLPPTKKAIPLVLKPDGLVAAVNEEDTQLANELNAVSQILQIRMEPVIEFIRKEIFPSQTVKSQEVVINKEYNACALCDLSSEDAVLEIKSVSYRDDDEINKEQLFLETNGRKCYLLETDMGCLPEKMIIQISKVSFGDGKMDNKERAIRVLQNDLPNKDLKVLSYNPRNDKAIVQCLICGDEREYKGSELRKDPVCYGCLLKRHRGNHNFEKTADTTSIDCI